MRYLSLFSGIEAASVAWAPLGWECVGVAEIDPFPCAVLRHHYPTVPNLGNISSIREEQVQALGRIDLVVGGFPCQDLSVAGKRKGLRNDDGSVTRSGLFFDAMRVVRWAAPRWLLVENVPGLYSSNGGRDFAEVVGDILGVSFDVPPGGWENAGVAASDAGLLEWATLDAQFFALAQRRQRVFALADFGDWHGRPPVLLERESLSGHPAPRREAGQVATPILEAGARTGRSTTDLRAGIGIGEPGDPMFTLQAGKQHAVADLAPTVPARRTGGGGLGTDFDCDGGLIAFGGNNASGPIDVATACQAHGGPHGRQDFGSETFLVGPVRSLRADGFDASEDGTVPVVAFSENLHGELVESDITRALQGSGGKPGQGYQATRVGMAVRRLTPKECCRLQGFPDDYLDILYRGKPAADGNKYKALGNSFAVPVVRWIGQRIAMVDAIQKEPAA